MPWDFRRKPSLIAARMMEGQSPPPYAMLKEAKFDSEGDCVSPILASVSGDC